MYNPFSSMPLGGALDPTFQAAWNQLVELHAQLENVEYLVKNIDAVRAAAENITRNILVVEGVAPALGGTDTYDLPTPIVLDDLLDYNVLVEATNGSIYNQMSGEFTATVVAPGYLTLTLAADAPAVLAGGTVRWAISYTV